MAESTFFVQECPTCGRNLQVRVEYLGRQLACQHCRGRFVAAAPAAAIPARLLQRAEELLELADRRLNRPR